MDEPQFLTNLGFRIKKIRMEKKMKQVDLAGSCAIEKASLSRLESGQTNPTILTLNKISKALDVPIREFFTE